MRELRGGLGKKSRVEEINGEKKRGLGAGNERMNNVEKKTLSPTF